MTESKTQRKKRLAREFNENRDKPPAKKAKAKPQYQYREDDYPPDPDKKPKRQTKAGRHLAALSTGAVLASIASMNNKD